MLTITVFLYSILIVIGTAIIIPLNILGGAAHIILNAHKIVPV